MSEEELGNEQQADGNSEPVTEEKLVPVGEAIRYRKRAQAAEKELGELKEAFEKQAEELKKIKGENEKGKIEEALRADFDTPSPLRDTPPLQGESMNKVVKTQGVKETRTGGARSVLQTAARQAAVSGSRSDVQEYLRVRRSFV